MKCAVCGSSLSQTRCGKNSRLICPKGHPQPKPGAYRAWVDGLTPEEAAREVARQGIGE